MKKGEPLSPPLSSPLTFTSLTSTCQCSHLAERRCYPGLCPEPSGGLRRNARHRWNGSHLRLHRRGCRHRRRWSRRDCRHRRRWSRRGCRHRHSSERYGRRRSSETRDTLRHLRRNCAVRCSSGIHDIHRSCLTSVVARWAVSCRAADEMSRVRTRPSMNRNSGAQHEEQFDSSSYRCFVPMGRRWAPSDSGSHRCSLPTVPIRSGSAA